MLSQQEIIKINELIIATTTSNTEMVKALNNLQIARKALRHSSMINAR